MLSIPRLFSALFLSLLSAASAAAQEAPEAAVAWIRDRAVPIRTVEAGQGFEDLQPLKRAIGDARIVSLGESTHGSREIFPDLFDAAIYIEETTPARPLGR